MRIAKPPETAEANGASASSTFPEASPEARKLAAAVLEVLAGAQAPAEAARTVGVSLARYYQLEVRAVAGLVAACEDRRRRKGGPRSGGELAALRRECEHLRREVARQQALARATRRTMGFNSEAAPVTPAETKPKQRRKRRPTARALKMASLLQVAPGTAHDAPAAGPSHTEGSAEGL
jgi:hypothetical protein